MIAAILGFVCLCATAWGDAKPVEDPDKFSEEVMRMISANSFAEAGKMLAEATGQPIQTESVAKALQVLDGKRFDFSSKVFDNKFGNALRQIVYYAYVENIGFLYFRFNFKQTSRGWVVANFNFKSETIELFPKDFVDR
jgi:hypothetical protein